ncbi:MAG: glycosyltransferase family 4 protein [Actinomycetota bacterium]|nr:glycosyltransferase family 4 protein [Actinomycetota bacterium]
MVEAVREALRILIVHGYLLSGTGSNQYVQALSQALSLQGHNVVVYCQENEPDFPFVTSYLRETSKSSGPELVWRRDSEFPGECMVYKPYIGEILPVFVRDGYRDFRVKEFVELEENELLAYVDANEDSLKRLIRQFSPDFVLVNHAVMLPYVLAEIRKEDSFPYFAIIHGSGIDFAVKRDPRYLHYASEGLAHAERIITPSEYTSREISKIFKGIVPSIGDKTHVISPGVDTEIFFPTGLSLSNSVETVISSIEERTSGLTVVDFARSPVKKRRTFDDESIEGEIERINALCPDWIPSKDAISPLRELARKNTPYFIFIGKLLETKGIQCVPFALPLIKRKHPDVKIVVVGFGELRGILELILESLDSGDIRALKKLCDYGNKRYAKRLEEPFGPICDFLSSLAGEGTLDDYLRLCVEREIRDSVIFTGYTRPREHRYLLEHAKALLAPSIAPEAFGMVLVEAMAMGVTPVSCTHSGLESALRPVFEVWGEESEDIALGTKEKMVTRIAAACSRVLEIPKRDLKARTKKVRELVSRNSSWLSVADRFVQLYRASEKHSRPE